MARTMTLLLLLAVAGCGDDGPGAGESAGPPVDSSPSPTPPPAGVPPVDSSPASPTAGVPAGTAGGTADAPPGDPSAGLLDLFGLEMSCDFIGSPFGHAGTATIRGTGTLPGGLDPGYQLNLMIGADGFQAGVLGENLFDIVSVCDTPTFGFEITGVDAGTYDLFVEVLDPDNDAATVYESQGDVAITVSDGATVEQDVRFD